MGSRIIKMDPAQGFAAQGAGAAVILAASHAGYPLSTTHVISGGVMGAGAAKRVSAVRWGVAGNIVIAWVLTIPAAATIGALDLRRDADLRRVERRRAGRRLGADPRRERRAVPQARAGRRRPGGDGVIVAKIIDGHAAWQAIWTAAVAGVGVTIVFSLAVLGATRSTDMRRDDRPGQAAVYGVARRWSALAATLGAVVYAITLITTK